MTTEQLNTIKLFLTLPKRQKKEKDRIQIKYTFKPISDLEILQILDPSNTGNSKKTLAKMKLFCEYYKEKVFEKTEYPVQFALNTRDNSLARFLGYKVQVGKSVNPNQLKKFFDKCQAIGLIRRTSESYSTGNWAKGYIINRSLAKRFLDNQVIVKDIEVKKADHLWSSTFSRINNKFGYRNEFINNSDLDSNDNKDNNYLDNNYIQYVYFLKSEVLEKGINSKYKGLSRKDVTDEQIYNSLLVRYPWLLQIESIINENNSMIPDVKQHQRLIPKIKVSTPGKRFFDIESGLELPSTAVTYNKDLHKYVRIINNIPVRDEKKDTDIKIKKIGIRAAHSRIALKKEDRVEYVKENFGQFFEFDVTSSIYRVAYFIKTGKWMDSSFDFYEYFLGRSFENGSERLFIKQLAMSVFFGKTTADTIKNIATKHREAEKEELSRILLNKSGDVYKLSYQFLEEYRNRMFSIIDSLDSEIFLHESGIYAIALNKILKAGFQCFQCYDGFYTDKDLTEERFNQIIEESAYEYLSLTNIRPVNVMKIGYRNEYLDNNDIKDNNYFNNYIQYVYFFRYYIMCHSLLKYHKRE